MKLATRIVYGAFGTIWLVLGVGALLMPSMGIPREAYSAVTVHLVREQGAHGVFLGFMAYWCLSHFEERRLVHFAQLLFAALFSAIHWAEFLNGQRPLLSPIVNSLPLLALGVTAPIRRS